MKPKSKAKWPSREVSNPAEQIKNFALKVSVSQGSSGSGIYASEEGYSEDSELTRRGAPCKKSSPS